MKKIFILSVGVILFSVFYVQAQAEEEDLSASGFNKQRIEVEEKLIVPFEKYDEAWAFLKKHYVDEKKNIIKLDPAFTSYYSDEEFFDTYFDTPDLKLYSDQSGVRSRKRINLSDPNDPKNGRELMQIKINDVSDNPLARCEIKYQIDRPIVFEDAEDKNPLLGIVKRSQRADFRDKLIALGLNPYSMKPIINVHDMRKRIYILKDGKPFLSLSLDKVDAEILWAKAQFVEIEPEINEIVFTEADAAGKKYMEKIEKEIIDEIRSNLPYLKQDLTPKYNKSLDRVRDKLPFFKMVLKAGVSYAEAIFICV
ncbi:MAG: CYTH domain-containing protein, partial [Candidatus Omnitrophica bacterium]|nr:CYTH domain-containing protein [Candidatus Omnitrophota bacterium]